MRAWLLSGLVCFASAAAAAEPPGVRVEARSEEFLAVGLVHGDHMSIHISRLKDNAPVSDAVVKVTLRGSAHSTVAEADGSYTLIDPDLTIPGAATLEIQVTQGAVQQTLTGRLAGEAAAAAGDKSQARQYWWWALNFGVCIGFLVLVSRRKKKPAPD